MLTCLFFTIPRGWYYVFLLIFSIEFNVDLGRLSNCLIVTDEATIIIYYAYDGKLSLKNIRWTGDESWKSLKTMRKC